MALFLTPRQVAELWGCSPEHVQRLCASGELRAMRLGLKSWRIGLEAVESYERRHTTSAEPEHPAAAPAPREVRPPVAIDGLTLPADYEPVFKDLWPGHVATTKKAALSGH